MRKTLFIALCSLYVAGCTPPPADDPEPPPPDAPEPPPPDAEPPPACADVEQFELDVFADEIMPILAGDIDLNNPGAEHSGCTRAACHGNDRGPDGLFLDESDTAANNLSRFACFVDLANPPASQLLVCAINDSACVTTPHPGVAVFSGVDDLNYQRVLSYLQGSSTEATLVDSAL